MCANGMPDDYQRLGEEADRAAALADFILSRPDEDARGLGVQGVLDLWMRPIEGPMKIVTATSGKKVGDLTMPEVVSWLVVLGYGAMTGYVIGKVAANVVLGPARRFA